MSKIEKTEEMFCYQCEQRAGCSGCTGARGVCGKSSKTALLQDKLTGSLVALAEAVGEQNVSEKTNRIMIEGLFATLTNVNFDDEALEKLIETALKEKEVYASGCSVCQAPCGRMEIYEMEKVWREPDEDIKSLKSLLLFGLRGIAAYAYHAMVLGYNDEEVNRFFYKGMSALGQDRTMENLLGIVMETGAVNFKCMELLDKANTETYGIPAPAEVSLKVEKGPFIVISGHDLKDLKMLLEQTEGKGINIYTHGEMLPAHAYPELRKYSHLKGNFGTAWQNQQKEFLKELFVRSGGSHIDHILRIGVQFTYGQRRNAVRNRRFDAGRKDDRCRRCFLGIGLGRRQVSNFCQISGSHLQFDCRILCFKELHFQ